MKINNIIRGIRAIKKLTKEGRQTFRSLPKKHRQAFYQLDQQTQKEYLLFLSILEVNDKQKIIETVTEKALSTAAPSSELFEYLSKEATKQRHLANTKIAELAGEEVAEKHKEISKEHYVPSAQELRERLNFLQEKRNRTYSKSKGLSH